MNSLISELKEHKRIIIFLIFFILLVIISLFLYLDYKNNGRIEKNIVEDEAYIKYQYAENEYKVVTISDLDMINYYYKDFIEMFINNQQSLWDNLDDDSRSKKFNNDYKTFSTYINKLKTSKTATSTVEKYKITDNGTYKLYSIITSENIKINFREYGIWKYNIEIEGKI